MERMDTFHCTPMHLCADMALQSTELQYLFRRFDIKPDIAIGPDTPRPKRAEATVRVVKATLHDLCAQIGNFPRAEASHCEITSA